MWRLEDNLMTLILPLVLGFQGFLGCQAHTTSTLLFKPFHQPHAVHTLLSPAFLVSFMSRLSKPMSYAGSHLPVVSLNSLVV